MIRTSEQTQLTFLRPLQLALASAVIFFGVISRPRLALTLTSDRPIIPIDYRSVSLSIADFIFLAFILLTLFRLIVDDSFRTRLVATGTQILQKLGGFWWLLLAIWIMPGIIWALEPAAIRFEFLHVLLCLALALTIAEVAATPDDRYLLLALIAGAGIQAVIAILQSLNNDPLGLDFIGEIDRIYYEPRSYYRAPGLAMHSNYLGGYLMLGLFACAAMLYQQWRDKKTLLPFLVVGLLITIGMMATLSRSAILGTAAGFAPVVLVVMFNLRPRLRLIAFSGLFLAVIGAGIVGFLALGSIENVQQRLFSGREFFFEFGWELIEERPVTGVGADNYMLEVWEDRFAAPQHILPVHNAYLFVWAELGIVGMGLFIAGCLWALWCALPPRLSSRFIWGCAFLAVCVVMLFDNYFWAVQPFRVLFFWVLGLLWVYVVSESDVEQPA